MHNRLKHEKRAGTAKKSVTRGLEKVKKLTYITVIEIDVCSPAHKLNECGKLGDGSG